jgi:5-methylcytosine-specific restriction endonuclease McrA
MKAKAAERLMQEFGAPVRDVVKVKSWNLSDRVGVVLQMDQPTRGETALLWLPHPGDGHSVPDLAIEYPAEAGRHSGTYPAPGLGRGEPALKLVIRTSQELEDTISYARAMSLSKVLPPVRRDETLNEGGDARSEIGNGPAIIDPATMPKAEPIKPRREAIPRAVQREVWQRDGGLCVECGSRERLCFDQIVPFSKGGSNSVRNLQLLCEKCNLAKSNRI